MADFDKYSNYTEETSFSEVVFGADSPLLEVEMNELQQILNVKLNRIAKQLGDGVFPEDENDYITFNDAGKSVNLHDVVVLSKRGLSVLVHNSQIVVPNNTTGTFYLLVRMKEVNATYESVLKSYGDTESNQIVNPIKDARYDNETSRRKVVEYTLLCVKNIPSDTEEYTYIKVGSFNWNNTTFSDWNPNLSNIYQLDKIANQVLINKNRINAMDLTGYDYTLSIPFTYYYCDNQVSGFPVLEDGTHLYYFSRFTDTRDADINKHFILYLLNSDLWVRLVSNNISVRKKYQLRATVEIGSTTKTDSASTFTINASMPHIRRTLSLEIIGGKPNSANPVTDNYVYPIDAIFRGQSSPLSGGSAGLGIIITINGLYELDNDDNWVLSSDTFENIYSEFSIQNRGYSNPVSYIRMGADLSQYGGDTDFDTLSLDYNDLSNKPKINDVTLQGNKTSSDLHIQGGTGTDNYEDLNNLPTLNGQTILGDMSETDPVYTEEKMSDEEVEDLLDEIFGEEE